MPTQHSAPILIRRTGTTANSVRLDRIHLVANPSGSSYDETFIRDLVFRHPEALPIDEIDPAYSGMVPVCCELTTAAGSIDCLFVNREGLLSVVECKLWRNPEARREVVAQILDYAKELGRWRYEDLQREVSKRLGKPGNSLFECVRKLHPELDEAAFVDSVSMGLRHGRFLLLIVGDGIREGVEKIADYLSQHSGLHFTLGLLEMSIFAMPNGDQLIQPRILSRTAIINRTVVELMDERMSVRPSDEAADERKADPTGDFYLRFWSEFLQGLNLDAVDQPVPEPSRLGNISFRLPVPGGYNCWITVYRNQSDGHVGVFVGSRRDTVGGEIQDKLRHDRDAIDRELGFEVHWRDGEDTRHFPICYREYGDLTEPRHRQEILAWLRTRLNAFVNAIRPRVVAITAEMGI